MRAEELMKAKINKSNLKGLRREKRNPAELYFKIRALDPTGENFHEVVARTIDISESGISFITFHPFAVGTEIEIMLGSDLVAKGQVVNLNKASQTGGLLGIVRRMSLLARNQSSLGLKDLFGMVKRMGVQITEKKGGWPVKSDQ